MKLLLVLAGTSSTVGLTISPSSRRRATPGRTDHVIGPANSNTTADVGYRHGDSSGDVLAFHNPVFNAADSKNHHRVPGCPIQMGSRLVRVQLDSVLPRGERPSRHQKAPLPKNCISMAAGAYRDARGVMELRSKAGDQEVRPRLRSLRDRGRPTLAAPSPASPLASESRRARLHLPDMHWTSQGISGLPASRARRPCRGATVAFATTGGG